MQLGAITHAWLLCYISILYQFLIGLASGVRRRDCKNDVLARFQKCFVASREAFVQNTTFSSILSSILCFSSSSIDITLAAHWFLDME